MLDAAQNPVWNRLAQFIPWVETLRERSSGCWLLPVSPGKWSIREILMHIMNWDRNSLDLMVPRMKAGAALFFVDIEQHNQAAAVAAASYSSLDSLINDVVSTRKQLLEMLGEHCEDNVQFTIDHEEYTYEKFIGIFTHHDEHHMKQIEDFLELKK